MDGFSNLSGSNIFLYNTGNSTSALMYYVSGDNDSHLGPSDSDVTEANTSNTNTTRFMFHYQSAQKLIRPLYVYKLIPKPVSFGERP